MAPLKQKTTPIASSQVEARPDITNASEPHPLSGSVPLASALADEPVGLRSRRAGPGRTAVDSAFGLVDRVGPLFDIIRHPKTQTPLTAAIYGSWGSGKTTAMKWLDGLLMEWQESSAFRDNQEKKHEDEQDRYDKIRTVWFYPWKYQSREDVWRGLIAEVIVETIKVKGADLETVRGAVARFGRFLGRSFLNVLDDVSIGTEAAGGSVKLDAVRKIVEDFQETNHPEREYLNEFESSFREWVASTIGENTRLVIFIDDLDRCMPGVALQVLEALKLYLNIDRLVFVVGIDRDVVNKRIVKLHDDEGVPEEYAAQYLAKMFQVEVALAPAEASIEGFLNLLVAGNEHWSKMAKAHQKVFRGFILSFGRRNPREVKRLINGAMMAGLGSLRSFELDARAQERVGSDEIERARLEALHIAQGMQAFCIRQVLERRTGEDHLHIGRFIFDRFLREWTKIQADNKSGEARRPIEVPQWWYKEHEGEPPEGNPAPDPEFAPEVFWPLLDQPGFSDFWILLADTDLAGLLAVPYPGTETADKGRDTLPDAAAESVETVDTPGNQPDASPAPEIVERARMAIVAGETKDAVIIRDAVALALNTRPESITLDLLEQCTELDLLGSDITNAEPLAGLTSLKLLDLSVTEITDASPLAGLVKLEELDLSGTNITDIEPLVHLTNLEILTLSRTGISDTGPLAGLMNLKSLDLDITGITDAEPLAGLKSLETLDLSGTGITDAGPLAGLMNLRDLYLAGTGITDASPLAGLTKLETLNLSGTGITDPGPINSLPALILVYLPLACHGKWRDRPGVQVYFAE